MKSASGQAEPVPTLTMKSDRKLMSTLSLAPVSAGVSPSDFTKVRGSCPELS